MTSASSPSAGLLLFSTPSSTSPASLVSVQPPPCRLPHSSGPHIHPPTYLSILTGSSSPDSRVLGPLSLPTYTRSVLALSLVPSRSRYVDFLPSHPPGSASVNRFHTCLPYPAPVIRSRDQPSPHLSRGDRARSEHSGSDCHPAAAPVQRHPGCSLTRVQQLKRA